MLQYFQIVFFLVLSLFAFLAQAQEDSLSLVAYELGLEDVQEQHSTFNQQKVVSGSRTLQDVNDLALTVYVITKEEIQKYGYVTLVDALKHLPGIRVSQPGNALDGELFLMRGLKGNSYAKIMINNVPVKPAVAGGMPLGAQLPIQQADRIEVIYGPAAALYGADASAGVINIILEKKDRPIFSQARLNAGNQTGYTDLNLLFGGKLGRNKRILNFSVYGSSTILDNRPTLYDSNVYDPTNYARTLPSGLLDTSYVLLQNFNGINASDVRLSSLPHLSRMFGFDLYFKKWRLSFQRMYRRDHSSIGLNTMAVDYGNPLNYFGEDLTNASMAYSRRKKKFGIDLIFSYLGYKVDNRSTTRYVNPSLFQAMDLQIREASLEPMTNNLNLAQYDSLRTAAYSYYFAGNRSTFAQSNEAGIEQFYTYAPSEWLELSMGLNLRLAIGTPLVTLARNPIDLTNSTQLGQLPIPLLDYLGFGGSTIFQAFIHRERWNMTLGLQSYSYFQTIQNNTSPFQSVRSPRLTFLYKINNTWSLRAFYGKAFRVPSPYYSANTFSINTNANQLLTIQRTNLNPETTNAYELGVRWRPSPKIKTDIVAFYNYTDNFIAYNFNRNITNLQDIESVVGYFNNNARGIVVSGVQGTIDYKNIIPSVALDVRLNFQYTSSFEFNQQNSFSAQEIPKWSLAGIISFSPFSKFSTTLLNVYQGQAPINEAETYDLNYYLLDAVFRYDLSDKFQLLLKINNATNSLYSGLQATRSSDDLYYNPQALRTWQVGLSYRTN